VNPIALEREGPVGDEGDELLVRRAADGDQLAFETLYRRLGGRIYALCLRMSGDAQAAEELTQDVFVRAWEKLDSFRGDSRFSTWLHRLAVNLVLQDRRKKGRRRSREQLTEDPTVFERAVTRAMPGTRVDLERAIAGLPEGAREVLILRDIEGYKYDEIAELKGVALGTVKAQIHRARKLVREALDR
jgi:RNA polymerase sigma-70 factor (ECF subfamily)